MPKDIGAKVFSTKDVEKPRFFHEHFTNTDSWILRSETVRLTKPGRYYLVAYSPAEPDRETLAFHREEGVVQPGRLQAIPDLGKENPGVSRGHRGSDAGNLGVSGRPAQCVM